MKPIAVAMSGLQPLGCWGHGCLFLVFVLCKQWPLRRANHSSRGMSVYVSLCVIKCNNNQRHLQLVARRISIKGVSTKNA